MGDSNSQKYFSLIILGVFFGILSLNVEDSFSSLQWNSDYTVGILKNESSEFGLDLQVTTYDKNSLKILWQEPETSKEIVGYTILRKTIDNDYNTIFENTNSLETTYVDRNMEKGYYGYKVIPILEEKEPENISMHGIHRNHSLFATYMKGQELLAQDLMEKICPKCLDESFTEKFAH